MLLAIDLPGMDGLDALRQFKVLGDLLIICLIVLHWNLDAVIRLGMGVLRKKSTCSGFMLKLHPKCFFNSYLNIESMEINGAR